MVDHPIVLHGLNQAARPTLLNRTDDDFIPAILEDLRRGTPGIGDIERTIASARDTANTLKLYQPVHRAFNVAVLEAVCDLFDSLAQPRLDPASVESAGLVVRRLAVDDKGNEIPGVYEGWQQSGKNLRGWRVFRSEREAKADPDPARRPVVSIGHPELDRQLRELRGNPPVFSEDVTPLFVAPPDVCEAAGRTVLYGLVNVTSAEFSARPASDEGRFTAADVTAGISNYFKEGGERTVLRSGQTLSPADADDPTLKNFILFLRQVAIEYDVFNTTNPASAELLNEINQLGLPFKDDRTALAGDFLQQAVRVLVSREPGVVEMPLKWPPISAEQAGRFAALIEAALESQLRFVSPNEGRYDALNRRYAVRAFVRVNREDGCPPEIFWSDYSEPFTIAPWYDAGDAPPVQVVLPDPFDKDYLANLKPNVSYVMPESLFNLLKNMDPVSMLKGEKPSTGGGIGLGWICSFSIPIITLCAFIVLNIFLQLLNIVFQWLLYIKICIPIPKSESA